MSYRGHGPSTPRSSDKRITAQITAIDPRGHDAGDWLATCSQVLDTDSGRLADNNRTLNQQRWSTPRWVDPAAWIKADGTDPMPLLRPVRAMGHDLTIGTA